jgi:hypothetical protein
MGGQLQLELCVVDANFSPIAFAALPIAPAFEKWLLYCGTRIIFGESRSFERSSLKAGKGKNESTKYS